jgi:hypothetical protein
MPLTERLTAILKAGKVQSAGDSIFGYRSINKTCRRAVLRAGLPDLRFHDLRHTVGTRLIQAGLDGAKVKQVLGYQTVEMTMRYTHLDGQEKVEAVNLLNRRNRQRFATDSATVGLTFLMEGPKTLANEVWRRRGAGVPPGLQIQSWGDWQLLDRIANLPFLLVKSLLAQYPGLPSFPPFSPPFSQQFSQQPNPATSLHS